MREKPFNILSENNDFIIVNKAPGLLTIPGRHNEKQPSLLTMLRSRYPQILTVHRIDKDTSGLIVFALHAEAHKELSLLFQNGMIEKKYWTITEGSINMDDVDLDYPIAKDPSRPGSMKIHPKGKPSFTSIHVLERFKRFTLVEASILTGRTHQIRVHLKHYGHPVICDPLYGNRNALFIEDVKKRMAQSRQMDNRIPLIARTALHAFSLKFNYIDKEYLFTVDPPKDFKASLNQMRKHDL